MAKDYHIFISHSWVHSQDLDDLRNLLRERGFLNISFEEVGTAVPINSTHATSLKHRLKQKISNSNIVLGIDGKHASSSEWMAWELETANNLDIPIVGVIPRGHVRKSTRLSQYSKTDIRWHTESIVEAIKIWSK